MPETLSYPLTVTHRLSRVFNCFKTALKTYPQLNRLVKSLIKWFDIWKTCILSSPPTFQDPVTSNLETCRLTVQTIGETLERLQTIIRYEHHTTESRWVVTKKAVLSDEENTWVLLNRLEQSYDPPGSLHLYGPRHNNNFANIVEIQICPTSDELMCPVPPYLLVTVPGAPHHLSTGSMERHLDIQFWLLCEDLT